MSTDPNLDALCWQDALDDGSLTLRAEHLLLRLPNDVIPENTCIYYPEIINHVANRVTESLTQATGDYMDELLNEIPNVFKLIARQPQHEQFIELQRIEDEWCLLQDWLAENATKQPSERRHRPTAQVHLHTA